jgi:DNA transformation protein
MPSPNKDFADYCCDLLTAVGRCEAKRMFGGWGISCDGLTFAIMTNLGDGDMLWLKADDDTRAQFEQAGCARFTYPSKGELKSMGYYAVPADAMESPALMAPWARLAFQAALKAQTAKLAKTPAQRPVATKKVAKKAATKKVAAAKKPTKPAAKRAAVKATRRPPSVPR